MTDATDERNDLSESIIEIVREALILDPGAAARVNMDSSFIEDLGIDSLTMVRIDMLVQAKLGLAVPPDEVVRIDRVSDLVDLLITHGEPVRD